MISESYPGDIRFFTFPRYYFYSSLLRYQLLRLLIYPILRLLLLYLIQSLQSDQSGMFERSQMYFCLMGPLCSRLIQVVGFFERPLAYT